MAVSAIGCRVLYFTGSLGCRPHEHARCAQAPVLLSLKATYAKAAVPTAAKVLLVRLHKCRRCS